MNGLYTGGEMLEWLTKYFHDREYEVKKYFPEFEPARVPLYCVKKEQEEIVDEIVIEITIDEIISKESFFPPFSIAAEGIENEEEAAPVRFYQYYFPKAKVFFAYPDYVRENDKFNEFKKVCVKRGIGLLKTSKTKIQETLESRSLFDQICAQLIIKDDKIKSKLEYHLRNCLNYFVYYPNSVFKKRAITGKAEEKMSFALVDKLLELKNIIYSEKLIELSSNIRRESRDDYEIAESYITILWDKYLGLKYPNIQRRVENILQRNEVYREHFVHQFQVFLIGAYILDKIHPKIAEKFEEQHDGSKIENVWLIASTFHDFSYGLQSFDTWLMQFFEDTLRIKNKQSKENLNLLNLDAAMIREELFNKIIEIINQLSNGKNNIENISRFFYEKAVRDRNHGVLSAISLLKLCDEVDKKDRKVSEKGILEAAFAIGCHDEDIWEALCGCQGYRRSSISLPPNKDKCAEECKRVLWASKQSKIFKEVLSEKSPVGEIKDKCESWERNLMEKELIKKIKFEDDPILFLLIFCDSVQDDGRVTSSDVVSKDRSSLNDINIETNKNKTLITVKLQADESRPKEEEIERVKWCLLDDRFRIFINDKLITFDQK